MNYILTTKRLSIPNFQVISTVKDFKLINARSVIIVDDFTDKEYDVIMFLVRSKMSTGFYGLASVDEDASLLIKEVVRLLNGLVLEDESYIESINSVSDLIEEIDNYQPDEVGVDTDSYYSTISAFVEEHLDKEPRATQKRLETSLMGLSDALDYSEKVGLIGQNFLSFVRDGIAHENRLMKEIDTAKRESEKSIGRTYAGGTGISTYPTYSHMESTKILLIKEYTPCQYLTSFLIALREYLYNVCNQSTRLLIICKDDEVVDTRYGNMTEISTRNLDANKSKASLNSELYTKTPTKAVLDAILKSVGTNIYIVVDRLYKKDPIITGRNIININAVSSISKMRTFNLKPNETIINNVGETSQLVYLQTIENFPSDTASRIDIIQRVFREDINRIAKLLGLQVTGR